MADVRLSLHIEADPLFDAVDTLLHIHERLAKRHGDRFRAMERQIEAFVGDDGSGVGTESLEPGRIVLTPPKEWQSLIAEARALGII